MERTETRPGQPSSESEREQEIAWIREHLDLFWSFSTEEYRESGRGALVVDTTQVVEQEGESTHPLIYLPQDHLDTFDWANKNELVRMVGEYDPAWEFIAVLWKAEAESAYRMGVYWEDAAHSEMNPVA